MKYRTTQEGQTVKLACSIAKCLVKGDVLLLYGGMGSGKTAFVRGLNLALACTTPASSPTFSLLHCYEGQLPLYHADLYRLESTQEADEIGLLDCIEDGIVAIEWPQILESSLPKHAIKVIFTYGDGEDERWIEVVGLGLRQPMGVEEFAIYGD